MSLDNAINYLRKTITALEKRKSLQLPPEMYSVARQRFVPSSLEIAIVNAEMGLQILVSQRHKRDDPEKNDARLMHPQTWVLGSSNYPGESRTEAISLDLMVKIDYFIDPEEITMLPYPFDFIREVSYREIYADGSSNKKKATYHERSMFGLILLADATFNQIRKKVIESNTVPDNKFCYHNVKAYLPGQIISEYADKGDSGWASEALSCLAKDVLYYQLEADLFKLKKEIGKSQASQKTISKFVELSNKELEMRAERELANRTFLLPPKDIGDIEGTFCY